MLAYILLALRAARAIVSPSQPDAKDHSNRPSY